ncbi:DUF221 family protein [Plectosphaerella cucumerina]|uniref:DUF221 family protein n=1 Tax=Plectosphaerella cucumerina TaxID=40658 RepID=A0A8K0WZN6_9PEZI|nr:DUF221 family protein [Plectosphaerella cucumerina]
MEGLLRRQDENDQAFDAGQELLKLLQDPFGRQLETNGFWAALGTSLAVTFGLALAFSLLRPYNQAVYAPKLKHADEKHAPPPIDRKIWSWFKPVWSTTEYEFIQHAGMDAAIFMRFILMLRNIFLVISVISLAVLIPVHITHVADYVEDRSNWMPLLTPLNVWGDAMWAQVVAAYLVDIVIMFFLWWNYRKVLHLRRRYFESEEYQHSLHARTLMLFDLPKDRSSDEGIARIIDEVVPSSSFARTAMARNVKDLPDLIAEHEKTVRKLESCLAKYMKNPAQLPASRPMCKPSKKDQSHDTYPKGQKVDAIDYLTQRIKQLEIEIKEVRLSVDKRSTKSYGFASYSDIAEAHNIAYACRKKHPAGSTIVLAPRPNDIIWNNMSLTSKTRKWRRFINNLWIALLTFVWIVPNAGIAIFLVRLSNLGKMWPAFQTELGRNPVFWGVVQGIASPAIMSLVFLVLPIIFRRLSMKAGDQTKTGRERHVLGKLYSFFVFNNLIVFSLFSAVWSFIAGVKDRTDKGADAWQAIIQANIGVAFFNALCTVSPFWVTWLLQRQLGAAIDLAQLWTLVYSFFVRKFSNPTPRELIELTAPPTFDYASYYNYFLYYTTIGLCFAGIQPICVPAVALYFAIDVWLKKYLLLYIFVTKTESGGMFWRALFNRVIFAAILGNLIVFLTCWVRGEQGMHMQAIAVAPLPFIMLIFKFICARQFDDKIRYYSTLNIAKHPESGIQKEQRLRSERLASRFGHPALYKPLITPMVHQKAQSSLHLVYKGRLTDGRDAGAADGMSVSGYSDTFALDPMHAGKPGKSANVPGFEFVSDSQMDFEYYKNRPEFAEEHGQGEIFGQDRDIMRPGTPGSAAGDSDYSRPGTPTMSGPLMGGMTGGQRKLQKSGTTDFSAYRPSPSGSGYASGRTSPGPSLPFAPPSAYGMERTRSPLYANANGSDTALVYDAAGMGGATPYGGNASRDHSVDSFRMQPTPGPINTLPGAGPRGYSGLPQGDVAETPDAGEQPQYDYFRGNRNTRSPGQGW